MERAVGDPQMLKRFGPLWPIPAAVSLYVLAAAWALGRRRPGAVHVASKALLLLMGWAVLAALIYRNTGFLWGAALPWLGLQYLWWSDRVARTFPEPSALADEARTVRENGRVH